MASTTKHGRWYSPWCSYFQALLDEKGINPTDFARLVDDRQNNIHQYLVGAIRPPTQKLDLWSRKLRLTEPEKSKWIRLAQLAYTPAVIREELEELAARLDSLESRLSHVRARIKDDGLDARKFGF